MTVTGRGAPGIFRIPGQVSVVNALYDHYISRMKLVDKAADMIQTTVASSELPQDIVVSAHDVASAFKKFLWDIPGGILGSMALFKAFKKIINARIGDNETVEQDAGRKKSQLVALTLLSLKSEQRYALISAIIGLLAFLKQDLQRPTDASTAPPEAPSAECMSSKALGLVFAPILLGNLTEQIELERDDASPLSTSKSESPKRSLFPQRKSDTRTRKGACSLEMVAGLERTTSAAQIVEFLVLHWSTVVQQVLIIAARYKMPASSLGTRMNSVPALTAILDDPGDRRRRSMKSFRSGSLSKSISNPILGCDSQLLDEFSRRDSAVSTGSRPISRSASTSFRPRDGPSENILHIDASTFQQFSLSTMAPSSRETKRWSSGQSAAESSAQDSCAASEVPAWWEKRNRECSSTSVMVDGQATIADSGPQLTCSNGVTARTEEHCSGPDVRISEHVLGRLRTSDISNPFKDPSHDSAELSFDGNGDTAVSAIGDKPPPNDIVKTVGTDQTMFEGSLLVVAGHMEEANDIKENATATRHDETAQVRSHKGSSLRIPAQRGSDETTGTSSTKSSLIPRPVHEVGRMRAAGNTPSPSAIAQRRARGQENNIATFSSPLCNQSNVEEKGSRGLSHTRSTTGQTTNSSQSSLRILVQDREAVPRRAVAPLPLGCEPPVARNISFRRAQEEGQGRQTSNHYSSDDSQWEPPRKPNVGTLYAEIRRLKSALDTRAEEAWQLRQQLEAMRRFRDSGTLSEKLREAERELRFWKHRAEWAEKSLFKKSNGSNQGEAI